MIGLQGFVLLTGGLFADPGAAFSLSVDLRGKAPENPWSPTWSFGLEGRFALPGTVYAREIADPDVPHFDQSLRVGQGTALLAGCARWKYAFGCGVMQGGAYYVENGESFSHSEAAFALGPRLGVRLPLGEHFALFGFGEALFPLARIGFKPLAAPGEPDPNVYWLPSVAQGYAAAGVEFTFE